MSTATLKIATKSPEDTQELGRRLGELAQPGDIYVLTGKLGAGKTTLTQGIARGLGTKENAMSPSFVLIHELKGRLPLYHIDLYRLDKIEEISALGLDDYLFGDGVSVVEWGEKAGDILPDESLSIEIEYLDGDERSIEIKANGARYEGLLKQLEARVK